MTVVGCHVQIHALEKSGGSIIGGAIKLLRDKKKNPAAPRDPTLPPKPKGQTVGSFRDGLKTLPEAIARKMDSKLRSATQKTLLCSDVYSDLVRSRRHC